MPAAIVGQCRRPRAQRHVDVGRLKELESCRQHADERVRLLVELNAAPEHVARAVEPARPQAVAQDDDARARPLRRRPR